MKKIILLFFSLLILLTACGEKYDNWQTISIEGTGKFKIPKEWIFSQKGDIIYIVDKPITENGYCIYLIGSIFHGNNDGTYVHLYELFENVVPGEHGPGAVLSNGANYGQQEFIINNVKETKLTLDLSDENRVHFIAWDNKIDNDTLIKIAKSFVVDLE